MKRRLAALVSAALAGLAAAGATAGARTADAPLPGYWRYDTSFLFSSKTEMRCITPADVDKVLQGPSNRHYDCTYPVREVADGKARFEGQCVNRKKGDKADVALRGVYGPTSFTFKGVVRPDLGGLSLPLNASIAATRVSARCPAG